MLIKLFPGQFPRKILFISFTKITFQMFIEVKTKFGRYFLWELGQIWNQTQYFAIKCTVQSECCSGQSVVVDHGDIILNNNNK